MRFDLDLACAPDSTRGDEPSTAHRASFERPASPDSLLRFPVGLDRADELVAAPAQALDR